jgi:transcriptional regulator with XRE-family HTH domain
MDHQSTDKQALGQRLAAARKLQGLTQQEAADDLKITKAAMSAWETGRNIPDALAMRKLAKLYGVSVDALLWDYALSVEAMQVAAWFDSLTESERRTYRAVILAFVQKGNQGGEALPTAPDDTDPHEWRVSGSLGAEEFGEAKKKPR